MTQFFTAFLDGEGVKEDYPEPGEERSFGFHNEGRENGYRDDETGALSWLNSARVVLDVEGDGVTFCASTGDPRGAFAFTLRRTLDGRILIHLPGPGEGMAHEETRELHPGTLEIGYRDIGGQWRPADRSDPEPDDEGGQQ